MTEFDDMKNILHYVFLWLNPFYLNETLLCVGGGGVYERR